GPLNTIIINRREPTGRRAFDMAHELFHLLTWRDMPPEHTEEEGKLPRSQKRVEQLADNFAAGLLMPRQRILELANHTFPSTDAAEGMAQWNREAATQLHVSGPAMKWRLVALKRLKKAAAERIPDDLLRTEAPGEMPSRFSRRFVATLGWGIEHGHLSARRAAT